MRFSVSRQRKTWRAEISSNPSYPQPALTASALVSIPENLFARWVLADVSDAESLCMKFWLLCRICFPLSYLISLKPPKCSRQIEHSSAKGMTLMSSLCLRVQLHFKQPWKRAFHFHPTTFPYVWSFSSFFTQLPLFCCFMGWIRADCRRLHLLEPKTIKFCFEHPSAAVVLPWPWESNCLFTAPQPFETTPSNGVILRESGVPNKKKSSSIFIVFDCMFGACTLFCVCAHLGTTVGTYMQVSLEVSSWIYPCVSLHIIHVYITGNV